MKTTEVRKRVVEIESAWTFARECGRMETHISKEEMWGTPSTRRIRCGPPAHSTPRRSQMWATRLNNKLSANNGSIVQCEF